MGGSEGGDQRSGKVVIATYREIAAHFRLKSGPDAGRMRAKRCGWPAEPSNHPSDPVRVRVPIEDWELPGSGGNRRSVRGEQEARTDATLQSLIAKLERDSGLLAEAQTKADLRAEEIAQLRERLGRLETERSWLDQRFRETKEERHELAQRLENAQEELAAWRDGGPVARAVRAFLYRRTSGS